MEKSEELSGNLPMGGPSGNQTFPRVCAPRDSLISLRTSLGQIFPASSCGFSTVCPRYKDELQDTIPAAGHPQGGDHQGASRRGGRARRGEGGGREGKRGQPEGEEETTRLNPSVFKSQDQLIRGGDEELCSIFPF